MSEDNKPSCREKFSSFIANTLRYISIGKLQLSLYFKETLSYSSIMGGIVSILLLGVMVAASFYFLAPVFDSNQNDYDQEFYLVPDIYNEALKNYQVSDLFYDNIDLISVSVQSKLQNIDEYCQDQMSLNFGKYYQLGSRPTVSENYTNYTIYNCQYSPQGQKGIPSPQPLFYYNKFTGKIQILQTLKISTSISEGQTEDDFTFRSIIIRFKNRFATDNGIKSLNKTLKFNVVQPEPTLIFQFQRFNVSDSLFSFSHDDDEAKVYVSQISLDPGELDPVNQVVHLGVNITFSVDEQFIQNTMYRLSIITAIANIGGVLAILKVFSIVVGIMHKLCFKRELNRELNKLVKQSEVKLKQTSDEQEWDYLIGGGSDYGDTPRDTNIEQSNKQKPEHMFSYKNLCDLMTLIQEQQITIQCQNARIVQLEQTIKKNY